MREIDEFLNTWVADTKVKALFCLLYQNFKNNKLQLTWQARPGACYSLYAAMPGATTDFAKLDIVDDDPEERWLSLCITKDMADDPENFGECIPKLFNNQDALCFDIDENNENISEYLQNLLNNAVQKLKPFK
jgi:hypothetical protein